MKELGKDTNYAIVFDFMRYIQASFITRNNELILDKRYNIYFNLANVKTKQDIERKIFAWVSRDLSKGGASKKTKLYLIKIINKYFGFDFSILDYYRIYCSLGNDVNSEKMEKFIKDHNTKELCGECDNCRYLTM